MNIRVDLNTPIKDGTEVVFRSPVDCSQVTGLKVYYPGESGNASKEFAFADAHGNNVGDIPHLFAGNVAVKVILDVITGRAFVQNADTNAYLEGRFTELENAIAAGGGNIDGGGSGGGSIAPLIVELFEDSTLGTMASHDPQEILIHVESGGNVYLKTEVETDELIALSYMDYGGQPVFTTISDDGFAYGYIISDDCSVYVFEHDLNVHTPVKGTDYWTAEDKAEMVADVIAALPVYNGEVL